MADSRRDLEALINQVITSRGLELLSNRRGEITQQCGDTGSPSSGEQHQSVQQERTAIFSSSRPGGSRGGRGAATYVGPRGAHSQTMFTPTRSYGQSRGRAQGNGRSRGSRSFSAPYNFSARRNNSASAKKEIKSRDAYLMNIGDCSVPRGSKRAPLFASGQVKVAVKVDSTWTAEEFITRMEGEFNHILNLEESPPRFEVMKYVNGSLVKPSLAINESWNGANVIANMKQGDLYLRSCHPLVLPEESHSGTILDSFLDRTISSHSEHVDTAMPEDHVDHTFVQDEELQVADEPVGAKGNVMHRLQEMFPDVAKETLIQASQQPDLNSATDYILSDGNISTTEEDEIDDNVSLTAAGIAYANLSPHDKLSGFLSSLKEETTQMLNISREKVLHQCIRLLKMKKINLSATPDVSFLGEEGIDAEGLTREFFTSLMTAIRVGESGIILFEGEFPNLVPIHSTDALHSGLFLMVGQLIAYSFTHSMIPLNGVSPAVACYLVHGKIELACDLLTMNDVVDLELRYIIGRINDAQEEKAILELVNDAEVATIIANSGFQEMLSLKNKQRAVQYIVLNDVILKRISELDQIRKGLKAPFPLVDFFCQKDIPVSYIFPKPEDVKILPADVKQKLKVIGEMTENSQKAFDWLHRFIDGLSSEADLKDVDETAMTIEKLLQFITGSRLLPQGKITVEFDNDSQAVLPDCECCFSKIILPLCLDTYEGFEKSMRTVISCQYKGTGRF